MLTTLFSTKSKISKHCVPRSLRNSFHFSTDIFFHFNQRVRVAAVYFSFKQSPQEKIHGDQIRTVGRPVCYFWKLISGEKPCDVMYILLRQTICTFQNYQRLHLVGQFTTQSLDDTIYFIDFINRLCPNVVRYPAYAVLITVTGDILYLMVL